ncbi:hypothetical protein O181_096701 [Austropuccinia psidii MF-1]|uniref:Uncharacterized protein n=1 Tax=Austropuccinia psidii MF-1 TaxID=1389203 RepID=A0A9Q3PEF5_9BASI|nr:hypothetical protein [Austropuccinia psidii MF-1]
MWEWVTSISPPSTCPPSPPALVVFSFSSSRASSPEEEPPSEVLAFYIFINGDYNTHLFVENPKNLFWIGDAANSQGSKPTTIHTYTLQPCNKNGRALTSFVQH